MSFVLLWFFTDAQSIKFVVLITQLLKMLTYEKVTIFISTSDDDSNESSSDEDSASDGEATSSDEGVSDDED